MGQEMEDDIDPSVWCWHDAKPTSEWDNVNILLWFVLEDAKAGIINENANDFIFLIANICFLLSLGSGDGGWHRSVHPMLTRRKPISKWNNANILLWFVLEDAEAGIINENANDFIFIFASLFAPAQWSGLIKSHWKAHYANFFFLAIYIVIFYARGVSVSVNKMHFIVRSACLLQAKLYARAILHSFCSKLIDLIFRNKIKRETDGRYVIAASGNLR